MIGKATVSPVNGDDRLCPDIAVATEPTLSPQQLDSSSSSIENPSCESRKPKRILHFSDGTLEQFSSDDEADSQDDDGQLKKVTVNESQVATVNPSTLAWIPWMMYHTNFAGQKALAVCDYLGGHLANFFGILSPKYEYEIEQYQKMLAEERERRSKDAEYNAGWTESPGSKDVVSTELKATSSIA